MLFLLNYILFWKITDVHSISDSSKMGPCGLTLPHCRLTSNDVSSLPPPLVDYFEVNPHISVQPSVF